MRLCARNQPRGLDEESILQYSGNQNDCRRVQRVLSNIVRRVRAICLTVGEGKSCNNIFQIFTVMTIARMDDI